MGKVIRWLKIVNLCHPYLTFLSLHKVNCAKGCIKNDAGYNTFMSNLTTRNKISWPYPLIYQKGRLSVWQKAFGILKNAKLDYTKELKKIRMEWDRQDS